MEKKLYKSNDDKILTGLCGGMGEYFGINSWIFRILFIVLGVGLLLYVIMAILIPVRPAGSEKSDQSSSYTATPKGYKSNNNSTYDENWGDEWETQKPSANKDDDDDKSNNNLTLG